MCEQDMHLSGPLSRACCMCRPEAKRAALAGPALPCASELLSASVALCGFCLVCQAWEAQQSAMSEPLCKARCMCMWQLGAALDGLWVPHPMNPSTSDALAGCLYVVRQRSESWGVTACACCVGCPLSAFAAACTDHPFLHGLLPTATAQISLTQCSTALYRTPSRQEQTP